MKKLMKAIAFATVMCMLLSTAAFASTATLTSTDYVLDVTVNAAGDEQVALLIVDTDANLASLESSQILYVGQMAAAEGVADFGEIAIDSAKGSKQVDVYAGYVSNATGNAMTVASNVDLESVKAITVAIDGDAYINDEISGDDGKVAAAVAMTVSFENAEGFTLSDVIFALDTNLGRKYTDAIGVTGFEVLEGACKIAAIINNGTVDNKTATISGVDAIFLFKDAQNNEQDVYTDPTDASNKN